MKADGTRDSRLTARRERPASTHGPAPSLGPTPKKDRVSSGDSAASCPRHCDDERSEVRWRVVGRRPATTPAAARPLQLRHRERLGRLQGAKRSLRGFVVVARVAGGRCGLAPPGTAPASPLRRQNSAIVWFLARPGRRERRRRNAGLTPHGPARATRIDPRPRSIYGSNIKKMTAPPASSSRRRAQRGEVEGRCS